MNDFPTHVALRNTRPRGGPLKTRQQTKLTSAVEFEVELFLFIFEEVELVLGIGVEAGENTGQFWRNQGLKNGSDRRNAEQEKVASHQVVHLVGEELIAHIDTEQRDTGHYRELGGVLRRNNFYVILLTDKYRTPHCLTCYKSCKHYTVYYNTQQVRGKREKTYLIIKPQFLKTLMHI